MLGHAEIIHIPTAADTLCFYWRLLALFCPQQHRIKMRHAPSLVKFHIASIMDFLKSEIANFCYRNAGEKF